MRLLIMFITTVCVLFLIKLRWPKNKSNINIHIKITNTYLQDDDLFCR